MLHLPAELVLSILAYLPLPVLASLPCVCRQWQDFFSTHESTIFRNAAYLHGYIPSHETLFPNEVARLYPPRSMEGLRGWNDLCRRRLTLSRSWHAHAPSSLITLPAPAHRPVHRLKPDPTHRFIITTSSSGGLSVLDMDTGRTLWSLPSTYIRPYAHLEYEDGWMVFDRLRGEKEVWCLEEMDTAEWTVVPSAKPDKYMRWIYPDIPLTEGEDTRGHFRPHALLRMPEHTSAYRFVYPRLLVAAAERVYLFDVRTGEQVLVVHDIQRVSATPESGRASGAPETSGSPTAVSGYPAPPAPAPMPAFTFQPGPLTYVLQPASQPPSMALGQLNYVDHSPAHIFICGERALRVFSTGLSSDSAAAPASGLGLDLVSASASDPASTAVCGSGSRNQQPAAHEEPGRLLLHIPSTQRSYGAWRAKLVQGGRGKSKGDQVVVEWGVEVVWGWMEGREWEEGQRVIDEFVAAHVSPCGQHIAALLSSSRLILISYFMRAVRGECSVYDISIDLQLGSPRAPSVYLAYGDGRVAVATQSGIFIVHPSFPNSPTMPPSLHVARVPHFYYPLYLARISCLQLTDTELFTNWDADPPEPLDEVWNNPRLEEDEGMDWDEEAWDSGDSEAAEEHRARMNTKQERSRERERRNMATVEEQYEREFDNSLGEKPLYANLPNGDLVVMDEGIHEMGVDVELDTSVVAGLQLLPQVDAYR